LSVAAILRRVKMRKLLVVTTMLVALSEFARAESPSLPPSIRGDWCYAGMAGKSDHKVSTTRYTRRKCKDSDGWMEIKSRRMEGHEWGCNIQRVAIAGTKLKVWSKCGGEGMTSDEEATLWFDGKYLVYQSVTSNVFSERPTMVCRDHRSTPPDDDFDPVTITLLTFDGTFRVAHTTRLGKTYVRSDQYRDVKVWEDENAEGVNWSGVWKKNLNKRMTGSFVTVIVGSSYRYTEKIYDGGRLETTTVSTCTEADGG
jgi:hypothetical protein